MISLVAFTLRSKLLIWYNYRFIPAEQTMPNNVDIVRVHDMGLLLVISYVLSKATIVLGLCRPTLHSRKKLESSILINLQSLINIYKIFIRVLKQKAQISHVVQSSFLSWFIFYLF